MTWRGTSDEAVVQQAAVLVAAQTDCRDEEALAKLERRADEMSRTVPDMARFVVSGVIRFDK